MSRALTRDAALQMQWHMMWPRQKREESGIRSRSYRAGATLSPLAGESLPPTLVPDGSPIKNVGDRLNRGSEH